MNESTQRVMFGSKGDERYTPIDFFDKLNEEFSFTLDPCCTEETALCDLFYTAQDDGLSKDWGTHRVFMNPPYSDCADWMKKAWESWKKGALVVALIPSRTDTKYWHDYVEPGRLDGSVEVRFVKGRLRFGCPGDLDGQVQDAAPFPSAVVIYRPCAVPRSASR